METLKSELASDVRVKVSGCDIDGTTRGKVIIKDKLLKSIDGGFGEQTALFHPADGSTTCTV